MGPGFNKSIVRGDLAVTLEVSREPDTTKRRTTITGGYQTTYSKGTVCAARKH